MTNSVELNNLTLNDINIGDIFEIERTFTPEDIDSFAKLSGDFSPLHVDQSYAETTEFGHRVIHGMLLASLFSTLVGMRIPGKAALYLGQDLSFRKPVFAGDPLLARAKVTAINPATSTLSISTEIRDADEKVVVSGTGRVKIRGDVATPVAGEKMPSNRSSEKPTVLITGGSRGIGAAIAKHIAQQFHCVLIYRSNDSEAAKTKSEIENAGGSVTLFKVDITSSDSIAAMITTIKDSGFNVTGLVNAAIGDLTSIPAIELKWDQFDGFFQTQVKAVLELSQAVHPLMCESGGGVIVNLLSQVVNNTPAPGMAHYVAAKYALLGLSKALAVEWARSNIRVNMVSPGLARTELTQHYQEKIFKMEAVKTPLGRLVETEDIANSVAYLLGDESSFMTGMNLYLTGGQDMV